MAAVTEGGVARWLQRAIGVALALAACGWLLVRPPPPAGDKPMQAIELPRSGELASPSGEIDAAIHRPLFWAGRKPVAVDTPAAVGDGEEIAPAEQTSFSFVATMLEANQQIAIVRSESSGIHRVREGDSVDGWQVSDIAAGKITLRSEQDLLELVPPAKPTVTLSEAQKPATKQSPAAANGAPDTATGTAESRGGAERARGRGRDGLARQGRGGEGRVGGNRGDRGGEETMPPAIDPENLSEAYKALGERLKGIGQ